MLLVKLLVAIIIIIIKKREFRIFVFFKHFTRSKTGKLLRCKGLLSSREYEEKKTLKENIKRIGIKKT